MSRVLTDIHVTSQVSGSTVLSMLGTIFHLVKGSNRKKLTPKIITRLLEVPHESTLRTQKKNSKRVQNR